MSRRAARLRWRGRRCAALPPRPPPAQAITASPARPATRSTRRRRRCPGGKHGDADLARKLTGRARSFTSAKSNTLVLYRSTGVDGKTVAGLRRRRVPKGKAPKGGWPVVT